MCKNDVVLGRAPLVSILEVRSELERAIESALKHGKDELNYKLLWTLIKILEEVKLKYTRRIILDIENKSDERTKYKYDRGEAEIWLTMKR